LIACLLIYRADYAVVTPFSWPSPTVPSFCLATGHITIFNKRLDVQSKNPDHHASGCISITPATAQ
jgi:hypothetical protein